MGEVLVVEFGESLTVADGLTHYNHGGQREVVVVNYLGKVFQLAAIDFLVGPCEVITGCHGRVGGIFL